MRTISLKGIWDAIRQTLIAIGIILFILAWGALLFFGAGGSNIRD